ncbi:hypothetical protein AB0I28_19115 [Phytomonospora sp. NPDC050363]|uniref:hypothetical protein n=1 Tax=Phytomonospora sp. NPDC050363 TaxID=3155642 RepID=UPI0033FFA328
MAHRPFDVARDARWVLQKQWLGPSEGLEAYAGVARRRCYVEVPGLGDDGRRPAPWIVRGLKAVLRGLGIVFMLAILGGGDPPSRLRRNARVIVWGERADCEAVRFAAPGPVGTGIWALTELRLAFLEAKPLPAVDLADPNSSGYLKPQPVDLRPLAEAPATAFRYEGVVERPVRKGVPVRFHRARFADGSGVDIRILSGAMEQ